MNRRSVIPRARVRGAPQPVLAESTAGLPCSTVLFLAADPLNAPRLRLDEECRTIENRIRGGKFGNQFTFRARLAARPDDLMQALVEDGPSVLHFSGHGCGDRGLCFVSDSGQIQTVRADALAHAFRAAGKNVIVVVLNACYTDVQAEALVTQVPCVVGTSDAIGDREAVIYAASFYRALAFGRSVANAYEQGLAALALEPSAGERRDLGGPETAGHVPRIKLLARPGIDPEQVYLVHTQDQRARCVVVLKARLQRFDADAFRRVTEQLRQWTGDVTLEVIRIEPGSVRVTIELMPKAANDLIERWNRGDMPEICGFPVSSVFEAPVVESSSTGSSGSVVADTLSFAARSSNWVEPGAYVPWVPPRLWRRIPIAVAAGALAIGALLLWLAYRNNHIESKIADGPTTPHPTPGMAWIDGGELRPGVFDLRFRPQACSTLGATEDCAELAHPERVAPQWVNAFELDVHEVSNEQFAAWLNDGRDRWIADRYGRIVTQQGNLPLVLASEDCLGALSLADRTVVLSPDKARWPAVCVTWYGADAYCRAQGKRLPSATEWEFAARGHTVGPFPWGSDSPRQDGVVFDMRNSSAPHPRDVASASQDVSPYGVRDLAGNVAEWVDDRGATPGTQMLRGGSWASQGPCHLLSSGCKRVPVDKFSKDVGFRCAR